MRGKGDAEHCSARVPACLSSIRARAPFHCNIGRYAPHVVAADVTIRRRRMRTCAATTALHRCPATKGGSLAETWDCPARQRLHTVSARRILRASQARTCTSGLCSSIRSPLAKRTSGMPLFGRKGGINAGPDIHTMRRSAAHFREVEHPRGVRRDHGKGSPASSPAVCTRAENPACPGRSGKPQRSITGS
jgi:hypothetical protein